MSLRVLTISVQLSAGSLLFLPFLWFDVFRSLVVCDFESLQSTSCLSLDKMNVLNISQSVYSYISRF